MKTKLVIASYDDRWPEDFKLEQSLLRTVLENEAVQIEHIGSTAVPKLSVKPIIDIMVGVDSLAYGETLISGLKGLDYEYVSKLKVSCPIDVISENQIGTYTAWSSPVLFGTTNCYFAIS